MAIVLVSLIVIILLIASSTRPTMAGPRTDLLGKICGDTVVQDESKYVTSYAKVLLSMQEFMPKNKFATGEDGENPNRIYVLAQCMDDLSPDNCDVCFFKISSRLVTCFPFTAGRVFLDGCFMRFDNHSFFQEITSKSFDTQKCSNSHFDSKEYRESATVLIDDLVETALGNKGYAAAKVTTSNDLSIYGMAICWKTVDTQLCAKCLANAKAAASHCLPSDEGRALNTGCFLRYSTYMFVNSNTAFANPDAMLLYLVYLLGAGSCFLAIFLVGVLVGKIIYKKRQNCRDEKRGVEIESLVTTSLRFKYSTLQKATENFSESHKIGQGGYGEVFKGALADGREIAIKRLFISGKHQMEAVCNEMDIICQAQHQNLVRFLGCCFANSSLLVYEFLPNGSLDLVLFALCENDLIYGFECIPWKEDPEKKKELDWKRRLGIINGIAQGLEYLHKDCQVRIVHRDIKASNILLDLKYRPKISDFDLARLYSNDNIVTSTAIAGTLGYMAPEYLAQGRLTEKIDVYSFGVLVLEIISGVQNNNYHSEDTLNTLVTSTWNHFQAKTVAEIIDRSMEVEDVNEVVRIVQIGLLCTQESPYLRPTITNVLQMLRQKNLQLPTPSKPPFADQFLTIPDSSLRSCKFYEVVDNLR